MHPDAPEPVVPARRSLQEGACPVDLDRTSAEIVAEGSEVLHEMRRAPPFGQWLKASHGGVGETSPTTGSRRASGPWARKGLWIWHSAA